MSIYFCLSALNAPWIIRLIEERKEEDFQILVNMKPWKQLFDHLYDPNRVLPLESPTFMTRNPLAFLGNLGRIRRWKKDMNSQLRSIQGEDVFFFGVAFCEFELWLVDRLQSQGNRIHFRPAVELQNPIEDRSLRATWGRRIRKWVFGLDFLPLRTGEKLYYTPAPHLWKDWGADLLQAEEVRPVPIPRERLQPFLPHEDCRLMILLGGMEPDMVAPEVYCQGMRAMIHRIEELFGEQIIAFKEHPRVPELDIGISFEERKIPAYVPANLILSHFSAVVGFFSAALFEAANEGLCVVSLLDFFPPHPKVDALKRYLLENNRGVIHFPKNLEELGNILLKVMPEEAKKRR